MNQRTLNIILMILIGLAVALIISGLIVELVEYYEMGV